MFKVGDYIVYPMYGAGIITEIVEKDFLGEMRTYYNVSLPYCRMEASVPVDNTEKLGVRPIIDPGRIDEPQLEQTIPRKHREDADWRHPGSGGGRKESRQDGQT